MNEIMKEVLERNLNKNILIFLKSKWRYKGILLSFDDNTLKLEDGKAGVIAIALDEISTVRGIEDGR